ncbi:hypothetical protein WN51_13912 [Melipona quadrifasciata]|uniref:Uncharacterized protein n=1 Tax=Melipona quadrifasciata TaxID=166423 RepID=A0A0N0BFU0_9HYME|nr:hypothetical protein WN51_13912 [Melipona quadrifasciata]
MRLNTHTSHCVRSDNSYLSSPALAAKDEETEVTSNNIITENDLSGGKPENRASSGATLMQRKLAIGRFGSHPFDVSTRLNLETFELCVGVIENRHQNLCDYEREIGFDLIFMDHSEDRLTSNISQLTEAKFEKGSFGSLGVKSEWALDAHSMLRCVELQIDEAKWKLQIDRRCVKNMTRPSVNCNSRLRSTSEKEFKDLSMPSEKVTLFNLLVRIPVVELYRCKHLRRRFGINRMYSLNTVAMNSFLKIFIEVVVSAPITPPHEISHKIHKNLETAVFSHGEPRELHVSVRESLNRNNRTDVISVLGSGIHRGPEQGIKPAAEAVRAAFDSGADLWGSYGARLYYSKQEDLEHAMTINYGLGGYLDLRGLLQTLVGKPILKGFHLDLFGFPRDTIVAFSQMKVLDLIFTQDTVTIPSLSYYFHEGADQNIQKSESLALFVAGSGVDSSILDQDERSFLKSCRMLKRNDLTRASDIFEARVPNILEITSKMANIHLSESQTKGVILD